MSTRDDLVYKLWSLNWSFANQQYHEQAGPLQRAGAGAWRREHAHALATAALTAAMRW